MTIVASTLIREEEKVRVAAAVRSAEEKTSGEIVPYVVPHSDHYEEAEWRAGFLTGLCALVGLTMVRTFSTAWVPLDVPEIGALTLLAGGAGMLVVRFLPGMKRLFAGKHLIDRRVAQRASEAFISEEVFKTRDRTGILIFVSVLERRVLVVGDSGINAKIEKDDWREVVRRVVDGLKAGKPGDGLVDGIALCGTLLERHGVARRADDRDELTDEIRESKE